ncbi:MAG: GxxExxY protein [Candidatus Omnitrophica bacterium]|nr:GxxExxY protein [Candidatus Omnitrophota bacterium]
MIADKKAYLYQDLTYQIRGACYEVYNTLGPGFKEEVYHRALAEECKLRRIPFTEKPRLALTYKGKAVGVYEPDFIIENKVILEIKAVPQMPTVFEAQLYYYLKGTEYRLGLLVNFGAAKLDIRRRIFDTARISGHPRPSYQRASAHSISGNPRQGQALLELAALGSLMIFVLGVVVNYGLNADFTQQVTMRAFRDALKSASAATGDDKPSAVAHLRLEDRHISSPTNPFAIGAVLPMAADVMPVTRNFKTQEAGGDIKELPRIQMTVQDNPVNCPSAQSGVPGCTTAGFRIENAPQGSVDRYVEIYGRSSVCDKTDCGGGDGECLKEEIDPLTGKPFCAELAKTLKIIDSCEGEIINYKSCVKQARRIVDPQVCVILCNKAKPPKCKDVCKDPVNHLDCDDCPEEKEITCEDLCNEPMNPPWYAQDATEQQGTHEDGTHLWTFPHLDALFAGIPALGLQRDYVKGTQMQNSLGKEDCVRDPNTGQCVDEQEDDKGKLSTTTSNTVQSGDAVQRTVFYNDNVDQGGVSKGIVNRQALERVDTVCVTSCSPGPGCPAGYQVTKPSGGGACPSPETTNWQTQMTAE